MAAELQLQLRMCAEKRGYGNCKGNSVGRGCDGCKRKRHGYSNSKGKCFGNCNGNPKTLQLLLLFPKVLAVDVVVSVPFPRQSAVSASNAVAVAVSAFRLWFLGP
jgi:hypothetical protein